ncbi:MAG: hypothetical protein MI725_13155 [Pirellulales bacterium]|nr:hypothetical protein [Pirellulales bacterium]
MSTPDSTPPIWCRIVRTVSRWKVLSLVLCGMTALVVSACFSAVQVPVPRVHDEFSYLLAADTFAEGRLANPTHPHWQHFESFHVIQQPRYASKYQPGQGAMLFLGTKLAGHPIVGAWLGMALAAAAVCWMLQGWMPPRWALVGGLLVALHGLIHLSWSQSYWGGSLPMTGGALMFGALPRVCQTTKVHDALLLALGAILLAATRPFEGLVVGLGVSGAIIAWLLGPRRLPVNVALTRLVLPAVSFLAMGVGWLAYYNAQVTGDPLKMPYQVHETQYGYSPLFLWQAPAEVPAYRHQVMHDFHTGWAIQDYFDQQTLFGWLKTKLTSLWWLGKFFLGGVLFVPLLMLPWYFRRRRLRFVWIALAVFFAAEMSVCWMLSHYVAPIVPLVFLLVVEGVRHVKALSRRGYAWARFAAPALLLLHLATLSFHFIQYAGGEAAGWQWQRARIAARLEATPGKHLVVVRYAADHRVFDEWVYNRADIDGAQVVWAREMDMASNQELIDYFSDRQIWLLQADTAQPQLAPYPQTQVLASPEIP